MKISELIKELQQHQQKHGDMEVYSCDWDSNRYCTDFTQVNVSPLVEEDSGAYGWNIPFDHLSDEDEMEDLCYELESEGHLEEGEEPKLSEPFVLIGPSAE